MDVMAPHEVREFVARNRFGMLGLAAEGNAYVVPLYYGFDGVSVYFSTRPGLKSRFMTTTREACFVIARVVSFDDWASVEVFGRLEEVRAGSGLTAAMNALMSVPLPPEWGVSGFGEPRRGDVGAGIYRLVPRDWSGRKSHPGGVPGVGGRATGDMHSGRVDIWDGGVRMGRAFKRRPVTLPRPFEAPRRPSGFVRRRSFRAGRTVKWGERLLMRTLERVPRAPR
jgi:nitroimidazol reductase NimA-like FMN-containing flavoprotein (pyridoxamine 5'-phosphate oxidase superfamily)